MNDRHRRVAKLKKQELNAAKAKLAREYGVSAEQAIKLVDGFVKATMETAGVIAHSIGEAFCKIGTSLSDAYKENNREKQ